MNPFALVLLVVLAVYGAVYVLRRDSRVGVLLVLTMFLTRFSVEIGGFNVRLEMVASLIAGAALLIRRERTQRLPVTSVISLMGVGVWLLGGLLASVINSPELTRSLGVLVWCALSVVGAVWVATHPREWPVMLRAGVTAAVISSLLAIGLWGAATLGLSTLGVQDDPTYGGWAAFVASIEANVLAGLLCLWAIVAAWNPGNFLSKLPRTLALFLAPVAILTTHTRAALLALVLGLVVVFVFRRAARPFVFVAGALGAVSAMVLVLRSGDQGFSKFSTLLDTSGGTGGLRVRQNTLAWQEWISSQAHLEGLGWNSFGQRHIDPTQPFKNLPSYIGNLPLQVVYDGGLLAALAVLVATVSVVARQIRTKHVGIMIALSLPYLLFSIATSVLWLFETWFWVGLAWGVVSRWTDTPSAVQQQQQRQPVA